MVPPLAEGQVYDLGNVKVLPCQSDLAATLKAKPRDEIISVTFQSRRGSTTVFPKGENLKTTLPPGVTDTMTITTQSCVVVNKEITTPAEGGKVMLASLPLVNPMNSLPPTWGK